MKNFLIIFVSLVLISPVFADTYQQIKNSSPEGVFKKTRNGEIVQRDKNGKKIGVYKKINGRYVKIK